jgi:hypothetical protein
VGVNCSQRVRLTTSPKSLSRLSRKCGILDVSQRYRPPLPVTGIILFTCTFLMDKMERKAYTKRRSNIDTSETCSSIFYANNSSWRLFYTLLCCRKVNHSLLQTLRTSFSVELFQTKYKCYLRFISCTELFVL